MNLKKTWTEGALGTILEVLGAKIELLLLIFPENGPILKTFFEKIAKMRKADQRIRRVSQFGCFLKSAEQNLRKGKASKLFFVLKCSSEFLYLEISL